MLKKTNSIKISIITPTKNSEKYIRETLESIKKQVIGINYEHIVVDAGSIDRTQKIVEEVGVSKFFVYENSSMYQAIDYGFKISHGEILCWLNSDDLFTDDSLQYVIDYFNNTKYNVITGDCLFIDEKSDKLYNYRFPFTHKYILQSFDFLYLCQPSTFFRRNVYFDIGGFDFSLNYSADRDYFYRILNKYRIIKVNKCFCKFRIHNMSLTNTRKINIALEDKYINKKLNLNFLFRKEISIIFNIIIKTLNIERILWSIKKKIKKYC